MQSLLIFLLLFTHGAADSDLQNDRLFRNAKMVQLLVPPGGKVYAGPLTLFIDPDTHKPVKSVRVNPSQNKLILAIQKRTGKRKSIGIYLVRPVFGRARRAIFRSIGGESHIVVPDDLGDVPIKNRIFKVGGERNGKKFIHGIGYYDVIAYTAKDAFLRPSIPLDGIDFISWKDGPNNPEKKIEAEGIDIGIKPPPPTKKGKQYEITGTVTAPGESEEELIIWIAYSEGNPQVRRQVIEMEKKIPQKDKKKKKEDDDRPIHREPLDPVEHAFEFIVIARTGPMERNLIKTAGVDKSESDFSGKGSLKIESWNPICKFPGKVKTFEKEFSPFNDGSGPDPSGTLFRQVLLGSTTIASGLYPSPFTYLDPATGLEMKSIRSVVALHEKDKEELIQVKVYFDELPPIESEEGETKEAREIFPNKSFSKPK